MSDTEEIIISEQNLDEEITKSKEKDLTKETVEDLKEVLNKKSSDIKDLETNVKEQVVEKGMSLGTTGIAVIFDSKTRNDLWSSMKGKIPGSGIIVFAVVMILFVASLVLSVITILGGVLAAAFAMRINRNKKGLAKYSKIMKAFVIGWPYVIYGSFYYK